MHTRLLTLALVLVAGAAHADPGEAEALIKEADFATNKSNCFAGNRIKEGCENRDVFPAAMAKLDEAVKADTGTATLLAACKLAVRAQGPDFAWLVQNHATTRVLAWCDVVAHDTKDDHARPTGRDVASGFRSRISSSLGAEQREQRLLDAAHALYGAGLKVSAGGPVSLAYGEMDAAALESIAAEVWGEYVAGAANNGDTFDKAHMKQYGELARQGRFGFVLLEPASKAKLCAMIAGDLGKQRNQMVDWCNIQGIKEAQSALYAFRGEAVSYPAGDADAGLKFDDAVLSGRPDGHWTVAVTVAGPPVDDQQHVERTRSLIGMASHVRKDREVAGIAARAEKVAKDKAAAFKADEARKVKRPQVAFAATSFETWTLPAFLKPADGPSCDQVHWKAYVPNKNDDGFDVELAVDGDTCYFSIVTGEQTDSLWQPTDTHQSSHCPDKLAAPGKHEVKSEVWTIKAFKTGAKRLENDGHIVEGWNSARDKKLGAWRQSCITQ